jgi:predicted PurR-regulated permease PerM
MQGQLMLGLIIGAITYIGLKIFFDFEQTLLLAFLAAFAELIPIIGPFIAAIPAIVIAIMTAG